MTSFWELAVRFGSVFVQLPTRTKVFVTLALIVTYMTLWFGAFGLRVWSIQYANEADYADKVELVFECNATKKLNQTSECQKARRVTSHTLLHNSIHEAWDKSYVCGGSPCIDVLFGTDSTFTGVVLRAAFVGLAITLVIVLGTWFRLGVQRVDNYFKNRATSQYSSYEALPSPEMATDAYDTSGVFGTHDRPRKSNNPRRRNGIVNTASNGAVPNSE